MRLGLQVSYFSWPDAPASIGSTFGRIARDAEAAGFWSLWVMDHFFQIESIGPPELDMLEGYSTLAFAAGQTSTIELGTLVTGVTYRHPGVLAKTVTTLDVLSGGRAWLGIGAAWFEGEHRALGVPYPPTAERFERLEETLQIALQMWAGDESPFAGQHYSLERLLNVPQSIRRPHPPIMIGGMGRKKTMRLVAQYADACNFFDAGPEVLGEVTGVLRAHCEDVGRSYDDIEKSVISRVTLSRDGTGTGPSGTPMVSVAQAVDKVGALGELGMDSVVLSMDNAEDPEVYSLVADLVQQAKGITPAGR